MGELDETAWLLAGRLMLLVHLTEAADDLISVSGLRTDHERLRKHGYNMTACGCVSKRLMVEPYPTVRNVPYMGSRVAHN